MACYGRKSKFADGWKGRWDDAAFSCNVFSTAYSALFSCIWPTVAIKSIHHPVWPVTCLTKLWFHQVGYWAVTTQINSSQRVSACCRSVTPVNICIYLYMYLNPLFTWPKTRWWWFFVIWGLLEAILVDQKINSSVANVTCDLCDLSSKSVGLWPVTAELI